VKEKLIILRQTPSEIALFGGEVYIDVDGKHLGILGRENFCLELEVGTHLLKMHKSHTMSSFSSGASN